MPSVQFPREWCLRTSSSFGVATSDFRLWTPPVRRFFDDLALFGGQTGFVGADAAKWVDSRVVRPHKDKTFEGAAAPNSPLDPPFVLDQATNLRVFEETSGSTYHVARVPLGADLHLCWTGNKSAFAAAPTGDGGSTFFAGGWNWRVVDGATGAPVATGVQSAPVAGTQNEWEGVLPAPVVGAQDRVLLAFVNVSGVQKTYVWPADYMKVTGSKEARPKELEWTHPTLGVLLYDPKYRVGALPYDRTDPVQAALLDETLALETSSELVNRPEWADYLLTFNADGTVESSGGEWSCLPICVGDAVWTPNAIHPNACAGACLWTEEGAELEARMVEPRLRSVNVIEPRANGTWLAGSIATRDGRATMLMCVDDNWNIVSLSTGNPFADSKAPSRAQSRALLGAVDGTAIRWGRNGEVFVLTMAGEMRREGDALVRHRVGGRAGAVLTRRDGQTFAAHLADPDLATSPAFARFGTPTGAGHVLLDTSPFPGPLVAKVVSGALCARETFWAVVQSTGKEKTKRPSEQTDKEPLDDQQGLARFTSGGIEVVGWWRATKWDMARVVPWSRGVYVFGFNAKGQPRAHRFTADGDGLLETGLQVPYLVFDGKCGLSPDKQTEVMSIVGRKFFGRQALPGWYAAESSWGTRGAGGVSAGGGQPQTDFSWDGSGFSISRAACLEAGFALDAFPPFLQWNEEGLCWLAGASQPTSVQGVPLVPYLVFDGSGDPLTFNIGADVVSPQDPVKWGALRFTSGTCQGVVSRRFVPDPNCGPMDVAIIIDISGSMGGALEDVKKEIALVCADLDAASGGDYRLALLTTNVTVRVNVQFAQNNITPFTTAIAGLQTIGGLTPWGEAINTVLNTLPAQGRMQEGDFSTAFRPDARKIIVAISDDWPDGLGSGFEEGRDDLIMQGFVDQAMSEGVQISTVFVTSGQGTGPPPIITAIMESASTSTNGLFVTTQPSGKGSAAGLSDIINSCGGNVEETFIEYCTEDAVSPVSSCGSARCVIEGTPDLRVGVFRVESEGPTLAAWLSEHSNPPAFRAMCKSEQRVWARLDGEGELSLSEGGVLTASDLAILSEFNVPLRIEREEWLPRSCRRLEVAIVVDEGTSLEVVLAACH